MMYGMVEYGPQDMTIEPLAGRVESFSGACGGHSFLHLTVRTGKDPEMFQDTAVEFDARNPVTFDGEVMKTPGQLARLLADLTGTVDVVLTPGKGAGGGYAAAFTRTRV